MIGVVLDHVSSSGGLLIWRHAKTGDQVAEVAELSGKSEVLPRNDSHGDSRIACTLCFTDRTTFS